MSDFQIIMPKLGESIQEATLTKWFVKVGDEVKEDDLLFEVATDKVDSEIPSPIDGRILKIFHPENSTVPVGELLAIVRIDEGGSETEGEIFENHGAEPTGISVQVQKSDNPVAGHGLSAKFISPLVRNIALKESVTAAELENIKGSGVAGRIQKKDILNYLVARDGSGIEAGLPETALTAGMPIRNEPVEQKKPPVTVGAGDQIIEMDRIRKLIADHMVMSKHVAPHVTSVVEADVTELVLWREKNKDTFAARHGEKITYMPLFIEAVARAITEFPMLNSSVDGDRIILKRDINIGIAVAKPDGNLIVPVIRNADQKNLVGLVRELNRYASNARENKLSPDDIRSGTFTITNFGTFRNLIGTPIINQPQVAILATGTIEKKPAVIELPTGDAIVVRHKMFLSLSYDHRVIDGALGGAFLRRIADILEGFDLNRII